MPIYRLGTLAPQLDPESWFAPNAVLIGDVVLCKNASLWWNVTLRGDCARLLIGEGSNVQDHSMLHTNVGLPLILGKNVSVGHGVLLHDCTVGDNSLIGIGAVVLNHAVIGKNSIVAAHTLVPERKIFPEGSLIMGSPGKVVRALSPEEIAQLPERAARYQQNWRRYRDELSEIIST